MDKIILSLSEKVSGVRREFVERVFSIYQDICKGNNANRLALLERVCSEIPDLGIENQLAVPDYNALIDRYRPLSPSDFTEHDVRKIEQLRRRLESVFIPGSFLHEFRMITPERFEKKLEHNGIRAYFDVVGIRIVPTDPIHLAKIVRYFRTMQGVTRLFWVNTFQYSEQDFVQRIGSNSSSLYRAVHVYMSLGKVFVEVQLRSPGIDVWSKIHHAVAYKPLVYISDDEKFEVMRFGEIANIVDLSSMLRSG